MFVVLLTTTTICLFTLIDKSLQVCVGTTCNNYTKNGMFSLFRLARGNYEPLECEEYPHEQLDYYYQDLNVTDVRLGLRALECSSFLSSSLCPNHWAVLLRLSNGKWVNMQFGDCGAKLNTRSSSISAALISGGDKFMRVRSSEYGPPKSNYTKWEAVRKFFDSIKFSYNADDYSLLTDNCQHFSRRIIQEITDKIVGAWPYENGPLFFDLPLLNFPPTNQDDWVYSLVALTSGYFATSTFQEIKVWYNDNGRLRSVLQGHNHNYARLAVLPNGDLASFDSVELNIWNPVNGQLKSRLHPKNMNFAHLIGLQNGEMIKDTQQGFGVQGKIEIINDWNGDVSFEFGKEHQNQISALLHLKKQNFILSASFDGTLKLWDLSHGNLSFTMEQAHDGAYIYSLALLYNGDIASSSNENIKIWSFNSVNNTIILKSVIEDKFDGSIGELIGLPNGHLASVNFGYGSTREIKIWDVKNGKLRRGIGNCKATRLALLSNGNLVSANFDKTISIWKS
jgi:WD40 repeat protein